MKKSIRHIKAIFLKELQDYRRNPITLLGLGFFIGGPLFLTVFFRGVTRNGNFKASYVAISMILIMCISAPATSFSASYIVEEKEKKTLDVLMLSEISTLEFFIGKNFLVMCTSILMSTVMLILFRVKLLYLPGLFILISVVTISELIVMSIIGFIAQNSIQSLIYLLPSMLIFMVLPEFQPFEVFSNINSFINISNMNFIIKNVLEGKGFFYSGYSLFVIGLWLIVPLIIFTYIYKKKKLY
ncbi:ABC-2 transporter permease [Clostridium felsineum]|uniref:hypothetical protein n=1 Tax=Clostridium felsineum TaxID=36839 RepID=UPI00098C7BC8|nr:hypothetical protein [Clostridium felsineum]URZ03628.1 hypothetical protein CLAUR_036890 [Clostridium felsineum]